MERKITGRSIMGKRVMEMKATMERRVIIMKLREHIPHIIKCHKKECAVIAVIIIVLAIL